MPYVITYDGDCQEYVGLPEDEKFPWVKRKLETLQLAEVYRRTERHRDRAGVVGACCTWLAYDILEDGVHRLSGANFCQQRLCPLCTERRAHKAAWKLGDVLKLAAEESPGLRYIFLTLTVSNVSGPELGTEIGRLCAGWNRLRRLRAFGRAVLGWFRAVECTYNSESDTYHPHIHAILAVPPAYFEHTGLWISHDDLVGMWKRSMGLDYDPSVRVEVTRGKRSGSGTDGASEAACLEAAKYATKSIEYLGKGLDMGTRVRVVDAYTDGLWGRRLTAYGGLLRKVARRAGADGVEEDTDLVHIGIGDKPQASGALVTWDYGWRSRVRDYVVTGERPPRSRH